MYGPKNLLRTLTTNDSNTIIVSLYADSEASWRKTNLLNLRAA